ncbi:hypothetical protein ACFR9S_06455, partial [Halolamina salina]
HWTIGEGGVSLGPGVVLLLVIAVLLASGSSIAVKAGLTLSGPRRFARSVAIWSVLLLAVTAAVAGAAILFGPGF